MNNLVKILPSQVKLNVKTAFEFCEQEWGSDGLMALVAFGSAVKPAIKEVVQQKKFLCVNYKSVSEERVEPNDIDIAAIYDREIERDELTKEEECRIRTRKYDNSTYSYYWADIQRCADLHLMCIDYDTLRENACVDSNLAAVFRDGLIVWGDLPRPMSRI